MAISTLFLLPNQTTNELIITSFNQRAAANKLIVQNTAIAAGIGFIPIPLLDMVGITSVQLSMIRDIAKVYHIPFKGHLIKSIIGSLIGNVGTVGLMKFIPVVGTVLGSSATAAGAAAATYALGQVFVEHFNQGGTLLDFDPVKSRAYFYKIFKENMAVANEWEAEKQVFLKNYESVLGIISDLKAIHIELKIIEKTHLELHEDAEQYIAELQEAIKDTDQYYQEKIQEKEVCISSLEKNNSRLKKTVSVLKRQLQEKNSKRMGKIKSSV